LSSKTSNFASFSSNMPPIEYDAKLLVLEDNDAVIKLLIVEAVG